MRPLTAYPCQTCAGTGTQPAIVGTSGRVLRDARCCPQCLGTGDVPRHAVAREIVQAAVSLRLYGYGDSPYRLWAEINGDAALLDPYRRALALGPVVLG